MPLPEIWIRPFTSVILFPPTSYTQTEGDVILVLWVSVSFYRRFSKLIFLHRDVHAC